MKKVTTQSTKKDGTIHTVYAMVDEATAAILATCDEKVRHEYILSMHNEYLNELKETRRHQSLDVFMENGIDFAAEEPDDESEKETLLKALKVAMQELTPEQQWLVKEVYVKKRAQREIARQLGLNHTSIRDQLRVIYKKIKKLLEK